MLIKFFKRPPKRTNGGKGGSPRASMDYLLNKPEGEVRVLQGHPELSVRLAEAMESANPYSVGCLSFEEADIPEEDKKAIIQKFEKSFLAGLDAEQYNTCWIEHTDKGRLELNFFVPNVELSTGKRLNLYYDRADRHLAESFKKAINLEYRLTSPDEPQKRQTVSIDKSLPKNTKDAVAALNGLIEHEFGQGNIENRQDVIACFERHGFEISRQGKDYLSIKNENSRNVRLKGVFYEQTFRADTARRAIAEAERGGSRESHRGEVEQAREHGVQQMYDGRSDNENMHSSGPTIQRPRVGKQYESFNDKGGLNEPDYEAVARGIERTKRDRQERVARYYRTAQEEHERCRAEARSRIEANQRAIEQVRDRKSGIKEIAQKLFERVRITVQKRIERYQERLQNNRGRGLY